jgi:hypothetical protein
LGIGGKSTGEPDTTFRGIGRRGPVLLFRGLSGPLLRYRIILPDTLTFRIHYPEVVLGSHVPLLNGLPIPLGGFRVVLSDTFPVIIRDAKVELGFRFPTLRLLEQNFYLLSKAGKTNAGSNTRIRGIAFKNLGEVTICSSMPSWCDKAL